MLSMSDEMRRLQAQSDNHGQASRLTCADCLHAVLGAEQAMQHRGDEVSEIRREGESVISAEPTAQQREVFGALLLVRYHLAELNRLAEDMPQALVDECSVLADACSDQDAADYATAVTTKLIELAR